MKVGFKILIASIFGLSASLANADPVNISWTADNVNISLDVCTSANPYLTGDCSSLVDVNNSALYPNFGDWRLADTETVDLAPGDYWFIFNAANSGGPAAFLAEISGASLSILTDASWQVSTNGLFWDAAATFGNNSTDGNIWNSIAGGIAGISGDAQWIWGSPEDNPLYLRTRVTVNAVPEPGTLALLGLGLAGLGFSRRKAAK